MVYCGLDIPAFIGVVQDAVVFLIAQTNAVRKILCVTGDVEIMILLLAICSYQIRPVIISFCCINIFDFGAVIAPKSTPIRIFHLISRMSELVRRLQGCITLETIVGPFVATHKFRHIGYGFVTVISVVSNLNFSFVFNARSCLLSCNHHNAVCCA